MATTPKFDESFKNLNPEQREAVECLDGRCSSLPVPAPARRSY